MITPRDLDDRVAAKYAALQLEAAEKHLDAELERAWEASSHDPIEVWFDPPVHRSVLQALQQKYSGPNKWSVELRSRNNDSNYEGLELRRYVAPYPGSGRD